ncbi:hypothetical protein J2751_001715 [Halorubrum alkaliphilum]|uniref:Domain of unknown function domain-containing protein n=1 Tax=Halorubrum alkaliphilum TaxID=261290 RepID=A0A8T4GH01_9EURY|nr:hypothetical protein [Halorubrum alkaliphilum]MBP1922701.1 hypothetical protein [Halorubrum alkaliphilum]
MAGDINREQHSLLRSDWRAYLKEGLGTTDNDRKLRERIRDRVVTGLYDVAILNQYARDDDIKQIFGRLSNDLTENTEQSDIVNGEDRELPETHFVAASALVSLAWRGLRECGIDRDRIFNQVVVRSIERAEADYQGVPHGRIESDISLSKLETHGDVEEMDPIDKWKRGLGLTGEDLRTLHNRVSDHPEVETTSGEDIGELIDEYLVKGDGRSD